MTQTQFEATIEDAEDGSGDGILTFPPEMIQELGWKEGDVLKLDVREDGLIYISNLSLSKTNNT
jgi:bifunctional DNA-binding transcriptional regulator/antitoxin component of YhaV-PrlF toxin-antitoxin module